MKLRLYAYLILQFFIFSSLVHASFGEEVANAAEAEVGGAYVWGGEDLSSGVDCSSFVQILIAKQGFNIPRTAAGQASGTSECPEITNLADAKIGDALYFYRSGRDKIGHVAIVTGFDYDGIPIITHAKGSKYGIVTERMSQHDIDTFRLAKRFAECNPDIQKEKEKDFLTEAYLQVTGHDRGGAVADRKFDEKFHFIDPFCCCNDNIMKLFRRDTAYLMGRTYPAIDLMISSLRWQKEYNDLTKKRIKNLKVLNALYSFSDKNGMNKPLSSLPSAKPAFADGCKPIDLNTPEGQRSYLDTVDMMENSGTGSYTAVNSKSGAYGRYQFIDETGSYYASKIPGCDNGAWKNGSEVGKACQDKMYVLFTSDQAKQLSDKGIPINTCTLYLAHQQGADGLLWYYGESTGARTFEGMKDKALSNVYGDKWRNAILNANTKEELMQAFGGYWATRFGGQNPFESIVGASFSGFSNELIQESLDNLNRSKWYRHGILLEHSGVNHGYVLYSKALDIFNSFLQAIISK